MVSMLFIDQINTVKSIMMIDEAIKKAPAKLITGA
jgi:hypothetical protein